MNETEVKREIFDFPIERLPSYVNVGGTQVKTKRDCIVRTDTKKIIGYVSAETIEKVNRLNGTIENVNRGYYKVVPHMELVTEARQAIGELGVVPKETSYMLHEGGRLYHQFDFPGETIAPVPNDLVSMRLTLVNSYDLSRPCGWELGGLRLVCTNGLVAFKRAFFEMRKHAGSFSMDHTIKNLKNAIITFKGDMRDYYAQLADTDIATSTGTEVITEMVHKGYMPEKYGKLIEEVWEHPERANSVIPEVDSKGKAIEGSYVTVMEDVSLDKARNLWTLYNAFTLILTHYIVSIEVRMKLHAIVQTKLNAMVKGR